MHVTNSMYYEFQGSVCNCRERSTSSQTCLSTVLEVAASTVATTFVALLSYIESKQTNCFGTTELPRLPINWPCAQPCWHRIGNEVETPSHAEAYVRNTLMTDHGFHLDWKTLCFSLLDIPFLFAFSCFFCHDWNNEVLTRITFKCTDLFHRYTRFKRQAAYRPSLLVWYCFSCLHNVLK